MLYSTMEYSFVQILDIAIGEGYRKLVADDDDEDFIDQKDIVAQIINVVLKESVTYGVCRLVRMSQNIHLCRREKSETNEAFADCFRGLAHLYLTHCYTTGTTQVSKNFAMLLFENARLVTSNFNNIENIFIADSETKAESQKEMTSVDKDILSAVEISYMELMQDWELYGTPNAPPNSPHTTVTTEHVKASLDAHKKSIDKIKPRKNRVKNHERVAYTISLEHTVSALKDIRTQDTSIRDTPKPLTDTRPPAHRHTTAESNNNDKDAGRRGTVMTKHVDFRNRNEDSQYVDGGNRQRPKVHSPANTGPKSNTLCIDCGERGHCRGDRECRIERDSKRIWCDNNKLKSNVNKPSHQYFQ